MIARRPRLRLNRCRRRWRPARSRWVQLAAGRCHASGRLSPGCVDRRTPGRQLRGAGLASDSRHVLRSRYSMEGKMRTTPVRQTLALTAALMWTVMIGGSVPLAQAQDDGTVGGLTLQSKTVEEDRQPSLLVG